MQTEQKIWAELRAELVEPIAKAHLVIREYGGATELGVKLGLGIMERKRRVQQICDFRPANADQFAIALGQLKSVTHAPEAEQLYRSFMSGISQRFSHEMATVLLKAIENVASKQKGGT